MPERCVYTIQFTCFVLTIIAYMKSVLVFSLVVFTIIGCKETKRTPSHPDVSKDLAAFFERYCEESLNLFPLQATAIGDHRYNDLLPISFTDSYRSKLEDFYERYLTELNNFEKDEMSEKDRLSYDVFVYETTRKIKGLAFTDNFTPFNQFYAVPLSMGQLGSG